MEREDPIGSAWDQPLSTTTFACSEGIWPFDLSFGCDGTSVPIEQRVLIYSEGCSTYPAVSYMDHFAEYTPSVPSSPLDCSSPNILYSPDNHSASFQAGLTPSSLASLVLRDNYNTSPLTGRTPDIGDPLNILQQRSHRRGAKRKTSKFYKCDMCDHQTSNLRNLGDHKRDDHGISAFKCEYCNTRVARYDNLESHKKHCSMLIDIWTEGSSYTKRKSAGNQLVSTDEIASLAVKRKALKAKLALAQARNAIEELQNTLEELGCS